MNARALAWALWAIAMVLAAVGGALVLVTLDARVPDNWGFRGYWDLLAPIIATPGLVLALRVPRNAIAWVLLLAGVAAAFGGAAQEYATYAVIVHPGLLPAAVPIAWLASWSFAFFAGPILVLIPQLFPDGHPLTSRWRPLVGAAGLFVVGVLVVFAFRPGPLENASFIENPVAARGPWEDLRLAVAGPVEVLVGALIVLSGVPLVIRFRRSRGIERQQFKWVALSASLIVVAMIGVLATTPTTTSNTSKPAQVFMILAFGTLPIAIGVAILRYRLYDIDLIINRAIVYGALSAVLAAAYVAFVVVFQAILRPLTGGSEVAVAASTLATVALIQPVRRRIQAIVDRRFYRSRYDAQQIVDTFTARLRDEVDLDDVRTQLLAAVNAAVRPRGAAVWLREQDA